MRTILVLLLLLPWPFLKRPTMRRPFMEVIADIEKEAKRFNGDAANDKKIREAIDRLAEEIAGGVYDF